MSFEVRRFPEWKSLYDAILPLIDAGEKVFDYARLNELAHIDIRSDRGRGQFYKFRRELLKNRQLWMENIPGCGYAVISSRDQPRAAYRRVRDARRKVVMAKAINTNIRIEELTPEQRVLQAATAAVLHELSKTFHAVGRKFALASSQSMHLPVDLAKLIESVSRSS